MYDFSELLEVLHDVICRPAKVTSYKIKQTGKNTFKIELRVYASDQSNSDVEDVAQIVEVLETAIDLELTGQQRFPFAQQNPAVDSQENPDSYRFETW